MHETRGIPASSVQPPPASPAPPKPAAPPAPDQASGTLAGFVSATRRLINKWTGAPPEVRISLPQGDLKLFKLSGHIDDRLALQAATWMIFVQAMKSDADLTLSIDSTGGSLTAGLSLIDVMLKAKCRIRTHCTRQALGIASIVLAAGSQGFRTISRASLITVPGAPGTGDGKTAAVFSPRVIAAIAAATRRPNVEVEKDLLKLKAVTPKLAVKHGLADAVAV
jgi:ATP-dependent Clp protease protease subunit